ncbi:MAG: hypothetical protein BWY95_02684 [Bacteroidetes bacterium ADurb.BinA104]|nr:MAG: hypothetical protein BWY95_02684 [Bacteroidetes bacterium ADurb.BinA104]
MKTTSNIPIPTTPLRWKEGEWFIAVNHKDNGVQPAEEEGRRYEADFTIVKELTAEAAILAFTRQQQDPVLDQQVIDSIEVNGGSALDVPLNYETKVSSTIFPPLPSTGWLEQGVIYSYNNGAVMVRQPHERTIYHPEQTPALFSFWRDNASAELAWMDCEKVEKGWKRTFGGKTYECLQPHQTQSDYTPTATLGVLWKEVPQQSDEYAVFVHPTGAHDVYMKGDIVWYPTLNSTLYRSKIDNNSWSPDEYANGWEIYVP